MDSLRVSERELKLLFEYQEISDYIYQVQKKSMESYKEKHKGESAFVYGNVEILRAKENGQESSMERVVPFEKETGMIWPAYLAAIDQESADGKLTTIFELGLKGDAASRFFGDMEAMFRTDRIRDLILRFYVEREIFDRERINEMLLLFRVDPIA